MSRHLAHRLQSRAAGDPARDVDELGTVPLVSPQVRTKMYCVLSSHKKVQRNTKYGGDASLVGRESAKVQTIVESMTCTSNNGITGGMKAF